MAGKTGGPSFFAAIIRSFFPELSASTGIRSFYPELSASTGIGIQYDKHHDGPKYCLHGKKAFPISSNGLLSFNIKGRVEYDKEFKKKNARAAAELTWGILNFQRDQDIQLKLGYAVSDNWLCNADKSSYDPRLRLKSFFGSLYRCLKRGARAVLQLYPKNEVQIEMITASAMRFGFAGSVVVDFPHRLVLDGSKSDSTQWVEMKTRSRAIYVFGWDANFASWLIMESYEECHHPPRLFALDKFDNNGASTCFKRYLDPSFFKMAGGQN